MEPKEGVYISPAYEAVVELDNHLECGSGAEMVRAGKYDNPNWLRNRAANCIALAEWIESTEKRRAGEAYALIARRNELAREFAAGGGFYQSCKESLQKAIDRIIEVESAS